MLNCKIAKMLSECYEKRNVNGALILLKDNMHNGILPLTKETLKLLL